MSISARRLFGAACLLASATAANAESANSDDAIIIDKTNYLYCMDATNRAIATAKSPYYVALMCTDFHSNNPLLTTRCSSYMPFSYCTVQDCEKEVHRLGATQRPLGGSATLQHACAKVDEYSQWTIIVPTAAEDHAARQESSNTSSSKCDPIAIIGDALFIHATVECNKNYMDSPAGLAMHDRALECRGSLSEEKYEATTKEAMQSFDADAKKNGKVKACRNIDNVWKNIHAERVPCKTHSC
jgi:hypothetical protein